MSSSLFSSSGDSDENQPSVFYFPKLKSSKLMAPKVSRSNSNGLPTPATFETNDHLSAVKFLIMQNDHYHQENSELVDICNELQIRFNEIEERNGKLERTHSNFKGYLKNLVETCKLYKQQTYWMTGLDKQLIRWWFIEKIYTLIWLANLTWINGDYFRFKILVNLVFGFVYMITLKYVKTNRETTNLRLKYNTIEIERTDHGNDLIHQLLDNL